MDQKGVFSNNIGSKCTFLAILGEKSINNEYNYIVLIENVT